MFVVMGVTGRTGAVVANTLLAQSAPVRVVVRNAKQGEPWKQKGAEVAVADLSNPESLKAAFTGAAGVYALNPNDFGTTDFVALATRNAQHLKNALDSNHVGHAVFLSSIGAQLPAGTGPIVTVHAAEAVLRTANTPVTFLRAGYFMENVLGLLPVMTGHKVFPATIGPDAQLEVVATADIGATAAELLRRGASSPRVVELGGPRTRSLRDIAAAFGAALGTTLQVVAVPPPERVAAFTGGGLPEHFAKAYAEMSHALETGLAHFDSTPRRGVVEVERFAALHASAT